MLKIAFLGQAFYVPPARKLLLTMKLTSLLLLVMCMQVYATTGHAQNINLSLREASIQQVLKALQKQTNYRFVYHNETLPAGKLVNVAAQNASLQAVLEQAFVGTNLAYEVKDDNLVVIYAGQAAAAKAALTVKGRVTGADNESLPGVAIRALGASVGTISDENGQYTIDVPANVSSLEFSLVGYVKQQVAINNRNVVNVTLQLDVKTLNSVTVTGYTNYTRNRSTSAAAVVGSDKITQVPMATFDQILQGRVPGLVVSSGSGQPGTSANVTLRGVGTINGNSSVLYVIDGVPIESGYLQALNPADIESMTVLKDASSKALYGSRGANGVIVVTTKKGKSGKLSVQYNSQYGVAKMTNSRTTMMNTAQRLQFEEEIGRETGQTIGPGWKYNRNNPDNAGLSASELARYDFMLDSISKLNVDWKDILLRHGKFTEQQISLSGGNDNVRFYSSINYYKQDGIVMRSGLERYTMKNNLDLNYGRFTANINMTLGYASSSFIEREGSSRINNPVASTMYALPYEYPYAGDGTMILPNNASDYGAFGDQEGATALEGLLNRTNTNNQLKGILAGGLAYNLGKGFTIKTRLGLDFRENLDQRFIKPGTYSGDNVDNGNKGSFGEGVRRNFSYITTSGITYAKTINRHDVEVSGFYEFNKSNYRAFNYTGYGIDERLPETPAGITPGTSDNPYIADLSGAREKRALASYMLVGRYTFDSRYTLNASFRYDGSSTVPANNRWHPFYSVGLGWEAKREAFLADIDWLNDLRFRASYGTTASPFNAAYGYQATYGLNSYNGLPGLGADQPGNNLYDWEYAKEFNIGFDFAAFNSRVRIVTDVYNKTTSGLFLEQPISLTSGFGTVLLNSGAVRNRGIEADVQGDVIKTKDFTWTLGFNLAYNKNEVTDLGESGEFERGTTEIVKVGLPLGTHYAPRWAGVDKNNGDPLYYEMDGKTITKSYSFYSLATTGFGSYIPPLTGGFNTGLSYKGIYLNALFSYANKTYRYNNEDYYNENPSFISGNQSTRMLYNRWKKPGEDAILPAITAARRFTSRDIQDASYIRLRNINIGYHLPAHIVQKLKFVKDVHVFVQGQNLYTWTKWKGFDPEDDNGEAMFDFPNPRTYTAGLNINF
ncbi:TonB-linked SusC/RagA family outer membrane protein [Chitinophaga skermanii]|uniref:TonB-linked SusC/RagA family outer membrane protein n=2 Tax=Chitinophaga skermanii TaxID=331697 RepID=A0A327QPT2_9BACT|nr:TonB-linked SusC/RagA family outer membrane protein [Chitinophaga skermanii]